MRGGPFGRGHGVHKVVQPGAPVAVAARGLSGHPAQPHLLQHALRGVVWDEHLGLDHRRAQVGEAQMDQLFGDLGGEPLPGEVGVDRVAQDRHPHAVVVGFHTNHGVAHHRAVHLDDEA